MLYIKVAWNKQQKAYLLPIPEKAFSVMSLSKPKPLLTAAGTACALFLTLSAICQPAVPSIYSRIEPGEDGRLQIATANGPVLYEVQDQPDFTLEQAMGQPVGTDDGLAFNFGEGVNGLLYYGFIPYGDSRHPGPVYFRVASPVVSGQATIQIRGNLSGRYDMIDWEGRGQGTLGYRLVNDRGQMIYDGIVRFEVNDRNGKFSVAPTVVEGPFVNQVRPDGALISLTTNESMRVNIEVDGKSFSDRGSDTYHEIQIEGLQPDTEYTYTVFGRRDDTLSQYSFRTALPKGSREPFTFAYTSDSRNGQGGGERDLFGTNFYIMKKMLALCTQQGASFMQFTGDLINGYRTNPASMDLEYANWKRAVQPYWHYLPIYVTMGNHEAISRNFLDDSTGAVISVDRWPFDTESGEVVFARNFSMPDNGPESEDGAAYDPDPGKMDFPPYAETVFSYTYGNVGMIALNSDYFYAPTTGGVQLSSGNIHGYILDNQLAWLRDQVNAFENDPDIDHVFVTIHTPAFPNGGHVVDDMWYNGNNQYRPYIAGKAMPKGIIERRDELLEIIVNQSSKVRALLTGDEHNYARTPLGPETNRYPETYFFPRIELTRSIYQINNGAAGAPYYAQEETPWSADVINFTTQNALVFIHVEGESVEVEVLNPDTLEEVDRFTLN